MSVITNLRMDLFEALVSILHCTSSKQISTQISVVNCTAVCVFDIQREGREIVLPYAIL